MAEPQLLQMVDKLRHEPFYEAGTWVDEALGVYVGWVARKGSFAEGMPLRNERGDVALVFAGEEFPEAGTAQALKGRGHGLDLEGPAYLAHLYEEDPSFPAGLNGRFHGLVMDRTRRIATLFNDRYGLARLYHHQATDTFYFAAEAKAILAVRPELRRLDPRSVGEIVTCGCVLNDRTLFPGIDVLPCAAKWTFAGGALERKGAYFRPSEWEDQPVLDAEAYYREFRSTFSRNLPRYFRSREAMGMSLTGGLDTRMIMAWHQVRPGALPCYTFGGTLRDCRDVVVARRVARACKQPHRVIPVGDEFLSKFPHYAERTVYLTDGCVDVSHAADLYVNEHAREIAPVRMTGNYGGEVLRGVRAFKPVEPGAGLFQGDLLPSIRQAGETFESLAGGHPLSFAAFRQAPWHHYGLLALEQTQLSLRSPFLDNDLVRVAYRAPKPALESDALSFRLIAEGRASLARIPTDLGLVAGRGGLAASLSHRGLHFLKRAEYAYDYGMPQWLAQLDHRLSPLHLERLFLGRHKFGHFRIWYRGPLSQYVREVLLDPRTRSRPYLDGARLEAIVRRHLGGVGNHTSDIHKVLTLELVHRLLLDDLMPSSARPMMPSMDAPTP
jgi:asparagine synthase (glutamine-hydrolysing)